VRMDEVLLFDGVWKGYPRARMRVPVLEDVSLSVGEGEIAAVVGGSGQGKTTLIRLASGTLLPDRGRVSVSGVDVSVLKDRQLARVLASSVGVATAAGPGVPVTVGEYVELALTAAKEGWRRRWRRGERRLMASAILDELGIGDCAGLGWDELSDWQRLLAELAQAVVVRPRLLLVDDVSDGFGLRQKQVVLDLLEGFARELGCGVLMAVSDHASALRSVRVWQLHRHRLRLMADHADEAVDEDADVIPLQLRRSDAT
jgi:putative ABC transport system ATP-binding protein